MARHRSRQTLSTRHELPVRSAVVYLSTTLAPVERRGCYELPASPENPDVLLRYRVVVLPETNFAELVSDDRPAAAVFGPVLRGGQSRAALSRATGLLVGHYRDHPVFPRLATLQYLLAELYSCAEDWRMAMQAQGIDMGEVVDSDDLFIQQVRATLERHRQEGRREGRREGRQEGRREGRQEGRREGRQEGRREGLLDLAARLFPESLPTLEGLRDVDEIARRIEALARTRDR